MAISGLTGELRIEDPDDPYVVTITATEDGEVKIGVTTDVAVWPGEDAPDEDSELAQEMKRRVGRWYDWFNALERPL